MRNKEKHEFALYVASLSDSVQNLLAQDLILTDETLVHRMMQVLRLQPGQECILFDQTMHIYCIIKSFVQKKQVICTIKYKEINCILSPKITFLLPVLKKEALETALYSLTEIGVTEIQLVLTQKTHHAFFNQKDMDRLQRIIIAAAEQSKNFAYPLLKAPVHLTTILDAYVTTNAKIFFDIKGESSTSVIYRLHIDKPSDIVLLVGPEGDLKNEEKELIISKNFTVCTLTPTVLRSVQAVALSAGLIRSLLVSILFICIQIELQIC